MSPARGSHGNNNFRIIGDLFRPPQISSSPRGNDGRYNRPDPAVNYMISYSERDKQMNLQFQERQSPKSSRAPNRDPMQQENVYQNEKKPNIPSLAQHQMFRPNSGSQVQQQYYNKQASAEQTKQAQQNLMQSSSDESAGEEQRSQ